MYRKTQLYQELCKINAKTEFKLFGGTMVKEFSKTLLEKCAKELSSTRAKEELILCKYLDSGPL